MQVYRIVDWNEHFENNRTRGLKVLSWVPVPNKQDGDGYTELMDHKNGAAHFGCWHAILQVASKCDPRGTLLRDGKRAHDLASLSRITRIPSVILKAAIERLLIIGWLEVYDNLAFDCDNPAGECASRARIPEGKGRERREGKEGKAEAEIPFSLNTTEFLKAWENWRQLRKEIKKPLTEKSIEMQMKDFTTWGVVRSIAAIEYTIKKGWQGIREPDAKQVGNTAPVGQRKPFLGELQKQLVEIREQKTRYWHKHSSLTAQGERLPEDRRGEYEEMRAKVRQLEIAIRTA